MLCCLSSFNVLLFFHNVYVSLLYLITALLFKYKGFEIILMYQLKLCDVQLVVVKTRPFLCFMLGTENIFT